MNLPSKIISTVVIALAIGMSIACSSSDETPLSNEPTNTSAATAAAPPTPTVQPSRHLAVKPTHARRSWTYSSNSNLPEDQRWCLAWALDNLRPHVYAEFRQLDPATMDDLDRTVWRERLRRPNYGQQYRGSIPTFDHDYNVSDTTSWTTLVGTCWMYWSEPLNKANADKRNLQFEAECLTKIAEEVDDTWERRTSRAANYGVPVNEVPDQYLRVLKWLHTPGEELMKMDEPPYETLRRLSDQAWAYETNHYSSHKDDPDFDLDWLGIIQAAGLYHRGSHQTEACRFYYPRLFYGYWVPFLNPRSEPPEQLSAEELAEIERLREGPLYLPRQ